MRKSRAFVVIAFVNTFGLNFVGLLPALFRRLSDVLTVDDLMAVVLGKIVSYAFPRNFYSGLRFSALGKD